MVKAQLFSVVLSVLYELTLIWFLGHRVKCYDNNIQALNSVYTRYQSDKAQLYADQVIESPNFTGSNNL